ncbi:MAG: (d)CMP kinase [Mycoplasmatales bacterium]
MIIAIDGPAGSGKGTVAKMLAEKLKITYLDTGAMYRAVAFVMCKANLTTLENQDKQAFLESIEIEFDEDKIFVNGEDATHAIREPQILPILSKITADPIVRDFLVKVQRAIGQKQSMVIEGRDIGSVVFPDADVKIYLDASVDVRTKRRFEQNQAMNITVSLEEIKASIEKRDFDDMNREVGPLIRVPDAIYMLTDNQTPEETIEEMLKCIRKEEK